MRSTDRAIESSAGQAIFHSKVIENDMASFR